MLGRHEFTPLVATEGAATMDHSAAPATTLQCLLVDDNAFDCMRIRRDMSKLDSPVELTVASTACGAYETMSRQRFGLLLIDYYLPDGDGFEIANWLMTSNSPNARTPRILLTGEDSPDVHAKALDLGYGSFISKYSLSLPDLEIAMASLVQMPE